MDQQQTLSTHNTNRHCRIRFNTFVGQPLSKQLYTAIHLVKLCSTVVYFAEPANKLKTLILLDIHIMEVMAKTSPELVVLSCAQTLETAKDAQEGNFSYSQALCLAELLNVARLYSYLADPAWQQCLDCLEQM